MKRDNMQARAVWRTVIWALAAVGISIQIVGLVANDDTIAANGQRIFTGAAILLLWTWSREDKGRIDELARRENLRFDKDNALNARLVELMDSAWRNDPVYRERRQKREANEKYFRELKEQNK